jgi:plastocyanin
MKKLSSLLVVMVILAGVMAAACSNNLTAGSTTSSTTTSVTTTPPITTTTSPPTTASSTPTTTVPSLSIVEPSSGNKFSIGSVQISVQVSGFNLINKIGQANAAGEGHLIYYMDVVPPTMAGMTAVTDPGTYGAVADTTYTWDNVGGGSHTFAAQLVNNDNTPLNPAVTASNTLLVIPEIGLPQAVIVTPRTNAVVNSSSVTVAAQVINFNLTDNTGQANASHEGHLIYYLDVQPPITQNQPATTSGNSYAASAVDSYTWQNVTAGAHKFYIQVVNNDNTPLNPAVIAGISITVTPPSTTPPSSTTPTTTSTSTPTTTATSTTTTAAGQPVTINLIAQNIAFDQNTLTVAAGAKVTINFTNKDNVPHNFALYTDSSASTTIFKGNIITNSSTTYTFTAPSTPGTYFFRCDVHPTSMTGSFIVK